jgi:hypothetical protein
MPKVVVTAGVKRWPTNARSGRLGRKLQSTAFRYLCLFPLRRGGMRSSRLFCEALPDRSNSNAAIFLGPVKETVPTPPLVLPPAAPGSLSSGLAEGRRRAGDRTIEPPMRYPVVLLQVVEGFSGAQFGDIAVRLATVRPRKAVGGAGSEAAGQLVSTASCRCGVSAD